MERVDRSLCRREKKRKEEKTDIQGATQRYMPVDKVKRGAKADNYLAPAPGHYHYARDAAFYAGKHVVNEDCISGYHLLLIACNYVISNIGNSNLSAFLLFFFFFFFYSAVR